MKKRVIWLTVIAAAIIAVSYVKKNYAPRSGESFVFPVSGKKNNIGSFWGDERDGGRRKHRGIDIFARKGTPVIAISDGVITASGNNSLGGKIIKLRPSGKLWFAYYAHLDQQLVTEGSYVHQGQVIGTVGNTGNARTTPSHLHFGIYSLFGAINPLPYIKSAPKILATIQH